MIFKAPFGAFFLRQRKKKLYINITRTEKIFIKNPYAAICFMLIFPDENTMALGGVLIGIMKAQLAARVKGIQRVRTDSPMPSPSIAIIGTKTETNAKLDISSVAKIEMKITRSNK